MLRFVYARMVLFLKKSQHLLEYYHVLIKVCVGHSGGTIQDKSG